MCLHGAVAEISDGMIETFFLRAKISIALLFWIISLIAWLEF